MGKPAALEKLEQGISAPVKNSDAIINLAHPILTKFRHKAVIPISDPEIYVLQPRSVVVSAPTSSVHANVIPVREPGRPVLSEEIPTANSDASDSSGVKLISITQNTQQERKEIDQQPVPMQSDQENKPIAQDPAQIDRVPTEVDDTPKN